VLKLKEKTVIMKQELKANQNQPDRTNFEQWYQEASPPWDIGRPQIAFVDLEKHLKIQSPVLDIGCGTGENALFLSEKGYEVVGADYSPTAIQRAKEKAKLRRLSAQFEVRDALKLSEIGRQFPCIIDCGLFHCFSDEDRALFVEQVSKTLTPGGCYHFLCFSEKETREGGPRRISQSEISVSFSQGWKIIELTETLFENTLHSGGSQAYLVSVQKI
jgi:cyclopropane fatty-acyl-phospholipid synthase-like methyltransferase